MRPILILLSGPVCSGKSDLVSRLNEQYGCDVLKTRELLETRSRNRSPTRRQLQNLGDRLDKKTNGEWVRDALRRHLGSDGVEKDRILVLDSVRIQGQIDAIRSGYGQRRVLHVHLTAPDETLRARYSERNRAGELPDYDELRRNATERKVEQLQDDADVVVDTGRCTSEDVLIRVSSLAGLAVSTHARNVDVLVGGQYGSEGKGQIADYLASEYDLVVRVGGPNAGHKVYGDGGVHVFHHLPSGSHAFPGKVALGPGAVIRLQKLREEIANHRISYEKLSIDPNAILIEDDDVCNEACLKESIASTGQGVGFATARKVLRNAKLTESGSGETLALNPPVQLAHEVEELQPYLRSTSELLRDAYSNGKRVLLEGTQGTLLSLHHGPYPHVTSRDTTASGCLAEAGIPPSRVRKIIMVVRTYPIRVGGTSGPMEQEIDFQTISDRSGVPLEEITGTEITTTTGRTRRIGEFEWNSLRRAAELNGPTDIALTFADYLDVDNQSARRFNQLGESTIFFIEEVERITGAKVSLVSTRFHDRAVIDRRNWRDV